MRALTARDDMHTSTSGCSGVTDHTNEFGCDIFVDAECAARRKIIPAMLALRECLERLLDV
jgi:hypothetical protein